MKNLNLLSTAFVFLISCSITAADKEFVDIQTIEMMCKSIYTNITDTSWSPECIIGLSRGGLIPAGFLAGETMFNNRNVKIIAITSYSDEGNQSKLKLIFPITHTELKELQRFKSILVVDDIADSGETLMFITDMLKGIVPDADVRTATLFYKKRSKIQPDYYAEETACWIVFPWEKKSIF